MIIITGATGQLGRLIVEELLTRLPPDRIGVSVRDPGKANDLAARGVRVRRGDFDDPAGLADAFEAATQVLIVSSNAAATGGDPLAQHRNAIAAARAAGARRIVYTSHMAASATSAFPPMRHHAATEAMLAGCGVDRTSLRNGFYASTIPRLVGDAARSGVLAAPADGKVCWTTHADLAAGAARVLADESRASGPTPPLTAGEALDLADVAAVLSRQAGRAVERRFIADEDYAARLAGLGLPRPAVDIMLGLFRASRAGEFEATDPALETLLARRPTAMGDWLRL